jgi:predicted component of type VI protein secretion system
MSNDGSDAQLASEVVAETQTMTSFAEMLRQEIKPRTQEGEEVVDKALAALVSEAMEEQAAFDGNVLARIDDIILHTST